MPVRWVTVVQRYGLVERFVVEHFGVVERFVVARRISLGGLVTAVLFVCLSLTPSLLPRTWLVQGITSGVLGSIGYGVGVGLAALWRWTIGRRWSPGRWPRIALVAAAGLLLAVSLYYGSVWQRQLYSLIGEPRPARLGYVRVLFATVVIVAVAIGLARSLMALDRWLTRLARRRFAPVPASAAGGAAVVLLTVVVVFGVVQDGFLSVATLASAATNNSTGSAAHAPVSPLRSGSPESLASWDSLGREGRSFVAGGPTREDLRTYAGDSALEPIRAYVGLGSGDDNQAAELAVRELKRTGAAARSVLCVVTTTGTGWVDPYGAAALEYMLAGDTAIVGTQFSYLPSWISFLSEQERSAQAGRVLFDHVYAWWSTLPPERRPRLVVFAESLGAYGSEAAFTDLADLRSRTDGALWLGPTNSNPLWSHLVAERDRGTPEVLPVYGAGEAVRFASRPGDLERPDTTWTTPRVVYLQNPSDPVTWWSPDLLFTRPTWLAEPRGYDVLPAMRWFPVVTFLQVTADLALAQRARVAHGHYFHGATVAGWAAVLRPPGWTPARSAALTALLDRVVILE